MSVQIPYKGTLLFYRRLLKTMMKTFEGDYEMFHRTRLEARREIIKNKDEMDHLKVRDLIFQGEEVRDFLKINLIQVYHSLFHHLTVVTIGEFTRQWSL